MAVKRLLEFKVNVNSVEALKIHGIDINASDNLSSIPILMSLCNNHPEVTRLLIDKGADVDTSSRFGYAPLHAAARNGSKEMSKKLLDERCDATYLVASQGQLETINCIIDWMRELKVDFEDSEKVSETALCGATSHSHFAVVQRLIELGVDVEKQSNYAGLSPLTYATASRLPITVQKLISANTDPFRPNAYGLNATTTLPVILLLLISLFSSSQDTTQRILHFAKSICERQFAIFSYQYLLFRVCRCPRMNTTGACLY